MRMAVATLSLLLIVLAAGCRGPFTFVKVVHDMGRQVEYGADEEEVRFDDAAHRLEISYKATRFDGSLVPRALVVPYDELQSFRTHALSDVNGRNFISEVYHAGPPHEVVARFLVLGEAPARDTQRRLSVLRIGDASLPDSRVEAALQALRKGQAVKVPNEKMLVPYDGGVYVFRFPYREESRPWATPARVALYPFALAGDLVVLPLQVIAFVVVWGPVALAGGI